MNDEIASKLEQLGEYVSILKGYQHFKMEDLMTDHTLKGAVERYLEVALECAIDIGEMIISKEKLKRPETTFCGIQEQAGSYVRENRYRKALQLPAE